MLTLVEQKTGPHLEVRFASASRPPPATTSLQHLPCRRSSEPEQRPSQEPSTAGFHRPLSRHTEIAGVAAEQHQSGDAVSRRDIGHLVAERLHGVRHIVAGSLGYLRRAIEEAARTA